MTDRTFRVTDETGRTYKVMLRGYYQDKITNERKLRTVVAAAMQSRYGKPFTAENYPHTNFWMACSLLGIITNKWLITK